MSTLNVPPLGIALVHALKEANLLDKFVKGCTDPTKYFSELTLGNMTAHSEGGFVWSDGLCFEERCKVAEIMQGTRRGDYG